MNSGQGGAHSAYCVLPPTPGSRCPAWLSSKLEQLFGAILTPEFPQETWISSACLLCQVLVVERKMERSTKTSSLGLYVFIKHPNCSNSPTDPPILEIRQSCLWQDSGSQAGPANVCGSQEGMCGLISTPGPKGWILVPQGLLVSEEACVGETGDPEKSKFSPIK